MVYATITISQNIQIGSGTPGLTLDGDDLYVTGNAEVDGTLAAKTGGAVTFVVAASDASTRIINQADYIADGTADDVEIQAAIDALPTAGGTVFLSEGTFTLAEGININDNDIAFVGSGYATLIKAGSSVTFTNSALVRTSGGKSRIRIANLTIDGNKANNTGGADNIRITSASSLVTIENVRSLNSDDVGISVDAATDVLVTGCYVDSPVTKGIDVTSDSVSHVRIEGCHILSTGEGGIEIDDGADYVTVVGNIFESAGPSTSYSAIDIHNHSGLAGPTQVSIIGNTIQGATSNGVVVKHVSGGSSIPREITIQGNTIAPIITGIGILVRGSEFVAVQGNSIVSGSRGIQVDTSSKYVTVTGNVARNAEFAGIELDAVTYVTVTGNVSVDDGAAVQNHGVLEDNGSDNNLIQGNVVLGNATAQITFAGASTIVRNNKSFVTENSGTGTITSGGTSVTITHGLSITPAAGDCTFVGAENPTNTVGTVWIDTYTSTQMNLNVENDPGASNFDVSWRCAVY